MEVVKYIGMVIYIVVCIAIIILALLQAKQSPGASGTIMGGESSGSGNFYEKNKGRTKEGKMDYYTLYSICNIIYCFKYCLDSSKLKSNLGVNEVIFIA